MHISATSISPSRAFTSWRSLKSAVSPRWYTVVSPILTTRPAGVLTVPFGVVEVCQAGVSRTETLPKSTVPPMFGSDTFSRPSSLSSFASSTIAATCAPVRFAIATVSPMWSAWPWVRKMCVGSSSSALTAAFGLPVMNGSIRTRVSPSVSSNAAWPRKRISIRCLPRWSLEFAWQHRHLAPDDSLARSRVRLQAAGGRGPCSACGAATTGRSERAGRIGHCRRRGRVPAERLARRRVDGRLLHADRGRPVRLRAYRCDERSVGRLCDGRQARDGFEPGGIPAGGAGRRRAARDPARRVRCRRRGRGGSGGRPLDRRPRAEVRDGGDGDGASGCGCAELDGSRRGRVVADEADRGRSCYYGHEA